MRQPEQSPPEPRVDVPALALLLDGAHHELRQRIRQILSRPSMSHIRVHSGEIDALLQALRASP